MLRSNKETAFGLLLIPCKTLRPLPITSNNISASGTLAAPGTLASSGAPIAQIYETIIVGVNHNIVRISGGALGFPIL